jgi:hypothetical protein
MKKDTAMKPFPDCAGSRIRERVPPAAHLWLLAPGTVFLYSLGDYLIFLTDIFIGFSAFTFLVRVDGIKNIHPG